MIISGKSIIMEMLNSIINGLFRISKIFPAFSSKSACSRRARRNTVDSW